MSKHEKEKQKGLFPMVINVVSKVLAELFASTLAKIIASIIIAGAGIFFYHIQNPGAQLNFDNWKYWGSVTVTSQENTVYFNGTVDSTAGYYTTTLDTSMRGKTITLVIENDKISDFSNDRLIKIIVNESEDIVKPLNLNTLVDKEYVPRGHSRIKFILPQNFEGKLGFVFTHANLNNLKITAYYR